MVLEQFTKISDILLDAVIDKKNYSQSIKKATAFGFWGDIAGSRFSKFSNPYDIKGTTLMVAVKNPQVMQELIFNQKKLLEKINDYFLPLNIKINDIRYNYKVWNSVNKNVELEGDDSLSYYSKNDIDGVLLNKNESEELSRVTDTISNMAFLNNELKESYTKNIINSIKAKKLRENKG